MPSEDFNFPPSSASAQSVPINFRMPAELNRVMDELFYSRKWSYRTPSDMYRHAMIRHAEWLSDQSPNKQNTEYLRAMAAALNKESEMTAFQQIMDQLRAQVHAYMDSGAREDAVRTVATQLGAIDGMPNGPTKTRFRERIHSEFGHLAGEIVEGKTVEALVSYSLEDAVDDE